MTKHKAKCQGKGQEKNLFHCQWSELTAKPGLEACLLLHILHKYVKKTDITMKNTWFSILCASYFVSAIHIS